MSQVIQLHERAQTAAVAGLNRITGLDFDQYPESLLDQVTNEDASDEDMVEEIGDADYPLPGEQRA